MKIDHNKLDELFSKEESSAAEEKAKSKVKTKAKVKTLPERDLLEIEDDDAVVIEEDTPQEIEEEAAQEPEAADEPAEVQSAELDDEASDEIPEDEKEIIEINPNKIVSTIFDWLGSLLIALVCVLLVMTFCFRVIDVDGTSMEPTLIDTDKVIITDLFYTPHNGDIIVISHGEDYQKPLIKRVIAIEGQELRIDFAKGKNEPHPEGETRIYVYINGEPLDETTYAYGATIAGDNPEMTELLRKGYVIPEGMLFVMGDNREISLDSRSKSVGLISVDDVIGKAQIDIIPHTKDGNGALHLDLSGIRYLY